MEKPIVRPAIIVEGKYDKIKLESLVSALIITTDGFRIFKDTKMRGLIKTLAEKRGIALLTDSDAAGFLIRRHLSGLVPPEQITHVYIPDLTGKERRKAQPSKEGKLGVEGIPAKLILEELRRAGFLDDSARHDDHLAITKRDLYEAGLSGSKDSRILRGKLIEALGLPSRLSAKALPEVLSRIMTREEFLSTVLQLTVDS